MTKYELIAAVARLIDNNWPVPVADPAPEPTAPAPEPTPGPEPTAPAPEPTPAQEPTPLPGPISAEAPVFLHSFENSTDENGFYTFQAKDPSRISLVDIARVGSKGLRLHTSGRDTDVVKSGSWERCELRMDEHKTDGFMGREHWYCFSMYLPDDFQMQKAGQVSPKFQYLLTQFHVKSKDAEGRDIGASQPPFGLYIMNYDPQTGPHFTWQLTGGTDHKKRRHVALNGAFPERNVWHDWVLHIKWGAEHGKGAISRVWLRKGDEDQYAKVFEDFDANTYPRAIMYLKHSNYHSNVGVPSSVIFDRCGMGNTPYSVAMAPLEGVPR